MAIQTSSKPDKSDLYMSSGCVRWAKENGHEELLKQVEDVIKKFKTAKAKAKTAPASKTPKAKTPASAPKNPTTKTRKPSAERLAIEMLEARRAAETTPSA